MEGRIITLEPTSIARYMALSQTIQESVRDGYPTTVLLSPGWKQKGLSIGKYQSVRHVNLEACEDDRVEIVRRPTEGYAVIHYTDDVTYGAAIPREYVKSIRLTKRGFDDIVRPILFRSLERIGVPNGYDPFPERYGNVFVDGRKISGSAQNRDNRDAWLQHGIIAFRTHDARDFVRYLNGESDLEKITSQMTSVEEEGGILNPNELVSVMVEEFSSHLLKLGIDLVQSSLSPEELERAEELVRTKYTNGEWLKSRKEEKSERVECFVWKKD